MPHRLPKIARSSRRVSFASLALVAGAALAVAACDPSQLTQTTQCTPQTCDYIVNTLVATGGSSSVLLADSNNTLYQYDGSQWQKVGAETATHRDLLLASPNFTTDHTLFLGNSASTDGGKTWMPLCVIVNAISPNFASDKTIFGTYTPVASGGTSNATGTPTTSGACPTAQGAFYESTDNGQSWQNVVGPTGAGDPGLLALSPNYGQDKTIFADFTVNLVTALYGSGDGGKSWSKVLDGKQNLVVLSTNFAQDKTVIAVSNDSAQRSTDGGQTWSKLATPINASQIAEIAFSPNYASDKTIALVSADVDAGTKDAHGTFISTDGGTTWNHTGDVVQRGTNRPAILFSPNYASDKTMYTSSLDMGKGPAQSTDNGATWTAINNGLELLAGLGG